MPAWLSGIPKDAVDIDGGSFTGGPLKIVLHSTETKNRPSVYGGGGAYPHLNATWNGKSLDVVQYIPLDRAARALVNLAGGVQTNRDSAIQIELTGTCNPAAPKDGRLFLPEAPDEYLEQVGLLLRQIAEETGCCLDVTANWAGLNDNGHASKSVRFSLAEWDNFGGICGHEHVPENDHVDPGSLDVRKALELSAGKDEKVKIVQVKPVPVPRHENAPAFPLPAGNWFGVPDSDPHNHSGYYSAHDRAEIRVWQQRMKDRGWNIEVDGLFGPGTKHICEQFQQQKRLGVDGLVGPITWAAAWTAPVTSD